MPFFLLSSSWVYLGIFGYIWEMNEQSTIMFKTFMCQQGVKIKDFQKDRMFSI